EELAEPSCLSPPLISDCESSSPAVTVYPAQDPTLRPTMPMDSNPGRRRVIAAIAIALLAVMAAVVGLLLGLMGILVGVILVALGVLLMADYLTTNPLTATAIAVVVAVWILGPNLDVQGLATMASSAVVSAVGSQAPSVVVCLSVFGALFLFALLK
ncbi:hypothetical protein EJB05_09524, partial [Eragrostis curvula]